ncbi:hypothetical protein D9613_011038 [Agrocybe pediades]|uniref:DUF6533 domain-containing protein n=1 Tax=Agrocybe pediades TaxID=84607 RepID=A0A8H4QKN8_9AGAR|nr:hypothetical protein D9613_011038 [Agrocybe pediades]
MEDDRGILAHRPIRKLFAMTDTVIRLIFPPLFTFFPLYYVLDPPQTTLLRMTESSYEALLETLRPTNVVGYAQIAGGALLAYDYLLTFGMEVNLIWKSQWNFIKWLYLFQRYLPFYDVFYVSFQRRLAPHLSARACEILNYQLGASFMVGYIASETLCSLRIWALWNNDKRFYIIFPAGVACIWIPGIYAMYLNVTEGKCFLGCLPLPSKSYVVWVWVSLLVYDAISLVFVIIPALDHCMLFTISLNIPMKAKPPPSVRGGVTSQSRLTQVVYRDGVTYYFIIFVFSLLNIIFSVRMKSESRTALATISRTIHCIFASRVLLNMRMTVRGQDVTLNDISSHSRNDIRFAAPAEVARSTAQETNIHLQTLILTTTHSSIGQ